LSASPPDFSNYLFEQKFQSQEIFCTWFLTFSHLSPHTVEHQKHKVNHLQLSHCTQWAHSHHVVYVQRDTLICTLIATCKQEYSPWSFYTRKQWCSLYWSDGVVKHLILQFFHIHSITPFTSFFTYSEKEKIKDEGKMCNLKQTAYMYWERRLLYSLSVFEHIMQIFITIKILFSLFTTFSSLLLFRHWKFHKHLNVVDYSSLWKI
jgi:hypothetical protein